MLTRSERLRLRLRHARQLARYIRFSFGAFPRECPVCGHCGKFLAFGLPPRLDNVCPKCSSGERQRQLALLHQRTGLLAGRDILHFAPERSTSRWIARLPVARYATADLFAAADLVLDIERMAVDDGSVDAIICSHVLEHVDDRRALSEMFRVLRPAGFALLMTPVVEGWSETYENSTVGGCRDRLLHFGQEDHVRYYGRDLRRRITETGFHLAEFTAHEPDVSRHGLVRGEKIFVAHKESPFIERLALA